MDIDCNETAKILSEDEQMQMYKTRDALLIKMMKMRLVLKELRRLKLPEDNIQQALKLINIGDYVKLGDTDSEYLFDLRDCFNVNLNYTERKAVREHLVNRLRVSLKPVVDFSHKLRAEIPEIFASTDVDHKTTSTATIDVSSSESSRTQILHQEVQRRKNMQKLVELRHRKCNFLKEAAELKLGPYLPNELELLNTQARLNQTKANLLRRYAIQELVTRTDHSLKAIKEVEGYVNEMLAKEDLDTN